jgi:hypothetical protein
MIITKTHVEYWQSRQLPSWAKPIMASKRLFYNEPTSVHEAVNAHVPVVEKPNTRKLMAQNNALALLKLVRKNQAYERKYGKPDSLLNYMSSYTTHDDRYPIYKRWVRKYGIQMVEGYFTRYNFIT